MRALLLLPLLAFPAWADGLDDWVQARIAEQRAAAPRVLSGGALWREQDPEKEALPGFVPPTSLAPLVHAVRGAVVNISARNQGSSRSLGSGFVINADGLIVTNNHVVERAQAIEVRLADGRVFDAVLVGRDPSTDLALLRVPPVEGLPTVFLGDSDALEVGDWVVAIGNPFGLDHSVAHGMISAKERVLGVGQFDDFIQTDALINPGNSGGPLFNMKGEVIGVNTAIISEGQGIGFAVPINLVKELLPNLLQNGRPERGWLGLTVQETGEGAARGPVVVDVFPGSPAELAGLKAGDRVSAVNGREVRRYQQVLRRIALLQPGSSVKVQITRGGRAFDFEAKLSTRPSAEALRALNSGGRIDALGVAVRVLDRNAAAALGVEPGLRIEVVVPGGPGERAGLALGDVITEVNRVSVMNLAQLEATLTEAPAGDPVLLKLRRGASSRYIAVGR